MRTFRVVIAVALGILLLSAAVPVSGGEGKAAIAAVRSLPRLSATVLPPLVLLGTLALIRRARHRDEQGLI